MSTTTMNTMSLDALGVTEMDEQTAAATNGGAFPWGGTLVGLIIMCVVEVANHSDQFVDGFHDGYHG